MENLAMSIPYLSVGKDRKLAGGDGLTCSPSPHIFIFSHSSSLTLYPSLCFPPNFPSSLWGEGVVEGASWQVP